MDQETLTRAIISNLIDRYIPELADDTNRSARKLVDMVERISDGHFQKILCQMMQEMGKNRFSPYYGMVRDIAQNTDKEMLKTFSLNLGYNSWTCGARNIRLLEMQSGVFIPWVLAFMRDPVPDRMEIAELIRLIQEAKQKEIYSYFLVYHDTFDEWNDLKPVIAASQDCVFGLLLDADPLSDDVFREIENFRNILVILNSETEGWYEKAVQLRKNKRLFAVYRTYTNETDAEAILSGEWIRSVLDTHPLAAASLPAFGCSPEVAEKVSEEMFNFRLKQLYPLMPVDLVSDCLIISDIISYRRQMLSFSPEGNVLKATGHVLEKTAVNAVGVSLEDIFRSFS